MCVGGVFLYCLDKNGCGSLRCDEDSGQMVRLVKTFLALVRHFFEVTAPSQFCTLSSGREANSFSTPRPCFTAPYYHVSSCMCKPSIVTKQQFRAMHL